jgi:hypothetical protein
MRTKVKLSRKQSKITWEWVNSVSWAWRWCNREIPGLHSNGFYNYLSVEEVTDWGRGFIGLRRVKMLRLHAKNSIEKIKTKQSNGQQVGLKKNDHEFAFTICAKNKEAALIEE